MAFTCLFLVIHKHKSRISLAILLFSCSQGESPRIEKIEHFYLSSTNSESLFRTLTDDFDLPIVWEYQDWGAFTSGGVTLGNVVLELLDSKTTKHNRPFGIALEPSHSLKRTLPVLAKTDISHGRVEESNHWSLLSVKEILPDSIHLFLCDYHHRKTVSQNRKQASEKLHGSEGGVLGIQSLEAIVINTHDPEGYGNKLAELPGIIQEEGQFHFSKGPSLKLVQADTLLFSLLIKVGSIKNAKQALESRGFKSQISDHQLVILDASFPVKMIFFE